jgi:hypothetical protein
MSAKIKLHASNAQLAHSSTTEPVSLNAPLEPSEPTEFAHHVTVLARLVLMPQSIPANLAPLDGFSTEPPAPISVDLANMSSTESAPSVHHHVLNVKTLTPVCHAPQATFFKESLANLHAIPDTTITAKDHALNAQSDAQTVA